MKKFLFFIFILAVYVLEIGVFGRFFNIFFISALPVITAFFVCKKNLSLAILMPLIYGFALDVAAGFRLPVNFLFSVVGLSGELLAQKRGLDFSSNKNAVLLTCSLAILRVLIMLAVSPAGFNLPYLSKTILLNILFSILCYFLFDFVWKKSVQREVL